MHDVTSAAYSKDPAWHGLGYVHPEDMTLEQAFEFVDLDWTVDEKPLFVQGASLIHGDSERPELIEVPGKLAYTRSDNNYILSVMGERYEPFQNHELRELIQAVMDLDLGCSVESSMVLGGGRDVVIQIKLNEWTLNGDDRTVNYLTVRNSHDGTCSLQLFGSSIRVVCRNTLIAALREALGLIKIRHTSSMRQRVDHAVAGIKDAREIGMQWEETANSLAGWHMQYHDMESIMTLVLDEIVKPLPPKEQDEIKFERVFAKRQKIEHEILNNHYGAYGQLENTGWDLFNRVTGFLDHQAQTRNSTSESKVARQILPESLSNRRKAVVLKTFQSAL